MITMLGSPKRCCHGVTRREALRAGALALGGRAGDRLAGPAPERAGDRSKAGQGEERDRSVFTRRRGHSGHGGHEARGAERGPGGVPADCDGGARPGDLRAFAVDGAMGPSAGDCALDDLSGGLPQSTPELHLKKYNLPYFDRPFSALLEVLEARGLLDESLVVVMSQMGRTPKINGNAGRDHWTYCFSVMLAGAGIRGRTVYGASDAQAAFVKDNPVPSADLCATIYHCLGIDPEMTVRDQTRRPQAIAHGGQPFRGVLS